MAAAVFAALRVASIGEHQAMVAFADDPEHVSLLESVRPALANTGVGVFLVAPVRSVGGGLPPAKRVGQVFRVQNSEVF